TVDQYKPCRFRPSADLKRRPFHDCRQFLQSRKHSNRGTTCLAMADDVLRFAEVNFRRDRRVFGIKREDRFSHVYIVGKTGTGKSTLLETMALEDLALGNGFAVIDPHGDLVERVAGQVPQCRRGEVIYFNAPDPAQPY